MFSLYVDGMNDASEAIMRYFTSWGEEYETPEEALEAELRRTLYDRRELERELEIKHLKTIHEYLEIQRRNGTTKL